MGVKIWQKKPGDTAPKSGTMIAGEACGGTREEKELERERAKKH